MGLTCNTNALLKMPVSCLPCDAIALMPSGLNHFYLLHACFGSSAQKALKPETGGL